MRRMLLILWCICLAALLAEGCKIPTLKSTDVMYGPNGEIVEMKSPDRTMKIKMKGDEVKIKGARGIGGQSRVAPLDVESGRVVGVHGVQVPPPSGHIAPAAPAAGVSAQQEPVTEETTVVH